MASRLVGACPNCGQVQVNSVQTMMYVIDKARRFIAYACPGCSLMITTPVSVQLAAKLTSIGVRTFEAHLPEEANEAHCGEPISWDDVLDAVLDLHRDRVLDELGEVVDTRT